MMHNGRFWIFLRKNEKSLLHDAGELAVQPIEFDGDFVAIQVADISRE
jgi:hypothetical protein